MYKECADLNELKLNGGFFIDKIEKNLLLAIENHLIKICSVKSKLKINRGNLFKYLSNLSESDTKQYFDLFNSSSIIMKAHYELENKYINQIFKVPVLWTYPNVRLDFKKRKKFQSPKHLDEWILFNGGKGIVAWFPLFQDSSLDLSLYKGRYRVNVHKYWGLKLDEKNFPRNSKIHFDEKIIKRGQVIFFRSDLFHKSSTNFLNSNCRITIQLRFEDFDENYINYERKVSQIISRKIIKRQKKILKLGGSN
jgi:hypothetical protein